MKRYTWAAILLSVTLALSAFIPSARAGSIPDDITVTNTLLNPADLFTDRDSDASYKENNSVVIELQGGTATAASESVIIDGGIITVTEAGTYIVTGELSDGMLIINVDKTEKVQLVLYNASIHSETSAALYILQADKVFLTLATDTTNSLSNGGQFIAIDENNIDAAIFSKEDLTINGTGSLSIHSPDGHGIVSKDDLVITGGSYTITAGSHGLSGKDSVRILNGSFYITSGKDGIHAENAEESDKGYLYIGNGTYQITADGDGLSASGVMQLDDGVFELTTGGGSTGMITQSESWDWGFSWNSDSSDDSDSTSTKGIKASGDLLVTGGTFIIDALDDALHSNANMTITGGVFQIATDDDGFHADDMLIFNGGTVTISQSYEGLEGQSLVLMDGVISVISTDDGLNAAGGNDQSGFGGFRGWDNFVESSDCYMLIAGGNLTVNANGDGLDSNGSLYITGGEIYVQGAENGGNGALDYDGEGIITGGRIIAAGASQMSQGFGSNSTQGVIMLSTGQQAAGSTIELTDESGNALVSWTVDQSYDYLVISCPELTDGGTYILTTGTSSQTIVMDGLIYGSQGGFGFGGGFDGGFGGVFDGGFDDGFSGEFGDEFDGGFDGGFDDGLDSGFGGEFGHEGFGGGPGGFGR